MKLKLPYGWTAFAALLTWPLAIFLGRLCAADAPPVAPVESVTVNFLPTTNIHQAYTLTVGKPPGDPVLDVSVPDDINHSKGPWIVTIGDSKIVVTSATQVDWSGVKEIARLKAENAALKKQLADAQSQPRSTITLTFSPVDGRSYFAISPPLSDLVFRVGIDEPAYPVIAPFTGTASPEAVPAPYVLTPNTGL